MQISILLFGIARDIVGSKTLEMDVENGCHAQDLKRAILARFPQFSELKYLGVAVNNEYATQDTAINDGDEVALIPPVSGG